MAKKFEPSEVKIGHLVAPVEAMEVVVVRFDDAGALLQCPRTLGALEAMHLNEGDRYRPNFIVRTDGGFYTFVSGYSAGASASTTHESIEQIRFPIAVATGAMGCDYREIHGMQSSLVGLARWSGLHAVRAQVEFPDSAAGKDLSVTYTAQNQPSIEIGGSLGLSLKTSFTTNPQAKDGVWSIFDDPILQTVSDDLRPWAEHVREHRMMQDLLCLSFGRTLRATIEAVYRADDQYEGIDPSKRLWHEAYQPEFARTGNISADGPLDPLFTLAEIDVQRLSDWLGQSERWHRPLWIAVSTMFQLHATTESITVQIGVALEALGYALWKATETDEDAKTPSFPCLLQSVLLSIPAEITAPFGGKSVNEWMKDFNGVFKGAKHADNDLPDIAYAARLNRQAMDLIRAWLATYLGADPALVEERLQRSPRYL